VIVTPRSVRYGGRRQSETMCLPVPRGLARSPAVGCPAGWRTHPRAVLDTLPAVVGYYDVDLRNRLANRAYAEFFGLTPEEINGRHISEVIGSQLYGLNRPHIERALRSEPQRFDRTVIDHSGEPRHMQVSYAPASATGTCGASRCC
jgi:PAS domain S-box-containing protein